MSTRLGAMAFVVGVRTLLFIAATGAVAAASVPVNAVQTRLPEPNNRLFPKIAKAREWLAGWLAERLPQWAERDGRMILLTTTRGMDRLDAVVGRIPDRVVSQWQRFAVWVMEVFLVVWAAILLAFLAAVVWGVGRLAVAAAEWALAYDWLSLLEPRAPPEIPSVDPVQSIISLIAAIPEIAYALAAVLAVTVIFIVLCWIVLLPFLPGLALHEFGHYAALRKAGASVEGYGLILAGPLLGGAFVQPGDDADLLEKKNTFAVWSGGIANSVLWGSVLIVAGVAIGGDPVAVLQAFFDYNTAPFLDPILASVLLLVGFFEIGNGFFNAVPLGPVDGGGFIKAVERDWWGFEDALNGITFGWGEADR